VTARGWFVVLEGIDGCGSTTQVEKLVAALRTDGISARATCEPSTGPVGVMIRSALEHRLCGPDDSPVELTGDSLALLFAADRLDHVAREVEPALAVGDVVVCDRYVLSSLAYQSAASSRRDDNLPWLESLNERALVPDVTIVIDVSDETAARRRAARGGKPELFETAELQRRLARLYGRAEHLLPGQHVVHVDGERAPDDVANDVRRVVRDLGELPR